MTSNNPFDTFGIEHLSASSINQFVNDPAMWVLKYVFKYKDYSSSSAVRGHTVEHGLYKYLLDGTEVDDAFLKDDHRTRVINPTSNCSDNEVNSDKFFEEQDKLKLFYDQGIESLQDKKGKLQRFQHKIIIDVTDLPVPLIGFIDFQFDNLIMDLKTTKMMPSKLNENVKRQMAVYAMAFPTCGMAVQYVSPKKNQRFAFCDVEQYKKQVKQIMFNIQRFLSVSNDPHELASMLYPNFDSWMWSDDLKQQASKIWRV